MNHRPIQDCRTSPLLPAMLLAALLAAGCNDNGDGGGGKGNGDGAPLPATEQEWRGATAALDGVEAAVTEAFDGRRFRQPVDLAFDPDGRAYVVERAGRILAFDPAAGGTATTVFLDIRDRVEDRGLEEGLLGLAFPPDYPTSGSFYVDYTADEPDRTVVARYGLDATRPGHARPGSEEVILTVGQPFANHNGGQIAFGPDGYLYIALGDGGSAADPMNHGQNPDTLLATILRIDPSAAEADRNYAIPPDNPFADGGGRPEVWAFGLRNPWRFGFDPETGELWAGDVGQDAMEEVDVIVAGGNYGWPQMEGTECYRAGCDPDAYRAPVTAYSHALGQSITGGFVYRGAKLPGLAGAYVYADYLSGRVWAVLRDPATEPPRVHGRQLLELGLNVSSFATDADRRLYLLDFDVNGAATPVYELVPAR